MRRYVNLSKQEQAVIKNIFPELDKVDRNEDSGLYQRFAVSVFDHWLTEGEAKHQLEGVSDEEQRIRNSKHYAFSSLLLDSFRCYTYRMQGHRRRQIVFKRFADSTVAKAYVKPAASGYGSERFFKLVIPEVRCLYYENWDDTNIVYAGSRECLEWLRKHAEQSDLYILEF